jgi:hypothetical protein
LIEQAAQLDMFPAIGEVESLDPRIVIGPATQVSGLYRVRYGGAATVHQVYHDRHGWYCGEHGRGCVAVSDAVATTRPR